MKKQKKVFSKKFKEETACLILDGKRSRREVREYFGIHRTVVDRRVRQHKSDPSESFPDKFEKLKNVA